MQPWIRQIKADMDTAAMAKIVADPVVEAPPATTVESLIESIRRFEDSLKKTVVFHPTNRELIDEWHATYEHQDSITLIQSYACPQNQVFVFPTDLFGSALS